MIVNSVKRFRMMAMVMAFALIWSFTLIDGGTASATTGKHPNSETPGSQTAYVFSTTPPGAGNNTIGVFQPLVEAHNYKVTQYTDTPGDANPGSATVENFLNTSNAGILYINTHGWSSCPVIGTPCLLVEQYDDSPQGLQALGNRLFNLINGPKFNANELAPCHLANLGVYGICITETGLRNHWSDNNTIVFAGACESWSIRGGFNAREFVGYSTSTCAADVSKDTKLFFERLHGKDGDGKYRSVGEAINKGGFTGAFNHLPKAGKMTDTVLSPAVKENYPGDRIQLFAPGTFQFYFEFDTKMDTSVKAEDVISISFHEGCQAEIVNAKWASDYKLTYDVKTNDTGSATITVYHDKAKSAGKFKNNLDGNQNPKGKDHVGPNKDDFKTTLSCSLLLGDDFDNKVYAIPDNYELVELEAPDEIMLIDSGDLIANIESADLTKDSVQLNLNTAIVEEDTPEPLVIGKGNFATEAPIVTIPDTTIDTTDVYVFPDREIASSLTIGGNIGVHNGISTGGTSPLKPLLVQPNPLNTLGLIVQ